VVGTTVVVVVVTSSLCVEIVNVVERDCCCRSHLSLVRALNDILYCFV